MAKEKRIIRGSGVLPPNAELAGVEGGRLQGDREKTLRALISQATSSRAQSAMDLQYAADQMEREDVQRGGDSRRTAAEKSIKDQLETITDVTMLERVEADLRQERERRIKDFRKMVQETVKHGGRPPLPPPPSAEDLTEPYEKMIRARINALPKRK